MNRKGQANFGLVAGLVGSVATLIIGIIIAFVVIGTLQTGNLIPQSQYTITNESDMTGPLAFANVTSFTVNGTLQSGAGGFIATSVWGDGNQTNGTQGGITKLPTGYTTLINSANYTLSSAGVLTNATTYVFPNVSISYTYYGDNSQGITIDNLTSNFSTGIGNVSSKIPTILLIAAIILILSVLAVLVGLWQRMRMGGGGSL